MNWRHFGKLGIALFLLLFIAGIAGNIWLSKSSSNFNGIAESGALDLRPAKLSERTVALDGEWLFTWDSLVEPQDFKKDNAKFIKLPSIWNGFDYDGTTLPAHGHATFQLKVVLDSKSDLAIYIPFVHSSYTLYVDDNMVAHAGRVGKSKIDYTPSARSNIVHINPSSDTAVLTLQVANYAYSAGGIWQSPQIGTSATVRSYYNRQLAFDLFIMGGLLLMGLYHIALYFLRKSIRSNLYFGLVCLFIALKSFFTGTVFFYTLFPSASYEIIIKMIQFTLFAPALLFWLFLRELFKNEFPSIVSKVMGTLVTIGLLITLFFPSHIHSQLMVPFLIMVALSMVFVIRGIYLAVKRRKSGALLILAGVVCFLITILHDMAIDFNVINSVYLTGAGFFIMIYTQAVLLAIKFTNSFKHVEKLTREKQEILAAQKKMLEEEVARQTLELREQKAYIEEKNREITDSITYAKRIQNAILPQGKLIKSFLSQSFILYKPKDIIAGDFYWLEKSGETILFAAADCTGHGVPGAMVSVVCVNGLNRSVREFALTDPGKVLDNTREIVIKEFEKSEEDVLDGMDISLCALGPEVTNGENMHRTMHWAGANNPLWIVRNGLEELEEIKPDKQPIGKYDRSKPFTTHEVKLYQGDTIYVFSDGYQDQFGGERGKKYKTANLKRKIIEISSQPIEKQKELLNEEFETWKGDLEQIDDVCFIGVRI